MCPWLKTLSILQPFLVHLIPVPFIRAQVNLILLPNQSGAIGSFVGYTALLLLYSPSHGSPGTLGTQNPVPLYSQIIESRISPSFLSLDSTQKVKNPSLIRLNPPFNLAPGNPSHGDLGYAAHSCGTNFLRSLKDS